MSKAACVVDMQHVDHMFENKKTLDDFSLCVNAQERLVIMGQSGSGKSTILRLLVGLLKPQRGSIKVGPIDITRLRRRKLSLVRQKIGMVFQSSALISSLSVEDNLRLPLEELTHKNKTEIDQIVDEVLAMVNLPDSRHLMPAELSGGMRKRVGLARALTLKPEIILYKDLQSNLNNQKIPSCNNFCQVILKVH